MEKRRGVVGKNGSFALTVNTWRGRFVSPHPLLPYEECAQIAGNGVTNSRKNGAWGESHRIFALSTLRQRGAKRQRGRLRWASHPAQMANVAGSADPLSRLTHRRGQWAATVIFV